MCRTAKAEWAGRVAHTSVVDAAGAIYVIGGQGNAGTQFQDVYASIDGGAQPDSVHGGVRRVLGGYSTGTRGGTNEYSRGTKG
jgi:hypothetical protein